MSQEASEEIRRELGLGEKLLWSGMPPRGIVLRRIDIFLIPLGLLFFWGGIFTASALIVFAGGTFREPLDPIVIIFIGIYLVGLFLLSGFYFVFGRFIIDAKKRANVYYGVTDQRIIVISGIFRREVKSLDLRTLSDIALVKKSDDSGTISFERKEKKPFSWLFPARRNPGLEHQYFVPAFWLSENAKKVYELIQKTQANCKEKQKILPDTRS